MTTNNLVERLTQSATQSRAHGWDGDARDLDQAAAELTRLQGRVAALEAENARLLSDPMNVGWQRAQDAIKDRAAAVSQWKAERIKRERAEAERDALRALK